MVEGPDTERAERNPPIRPRLLPIMAAVAVAIGGIALLPVPTPVPSDESLPTLDFALPEEVAESFMEAWERGDSEAAASLFRPGAKFHGFEPDMFPALEEWYRAVGQEYRGRGCELLAGHSTVVSCDYWYSNKLTRTQSVEPMTGRHTVFVKNGAIDRMIDVFLPFAYLDFFGFIDWVSTNHPDDFHLMFRFSRYLSPNYPLLDPTSIALWEQYSDEFVASTRGETEYFGQVREICTAAHARLNEELQAAGIEMQLPNGPDIDRLYLLPAREADWAPYEAAARRIIGETLPELRALPSPPAIEDEFDHLYTVIEEFARGEEAPFTPTPEFWIHQVDRQPSQSLSRCTFSLSR